MSMPAGKPEPAGQAKEAPMRGSYDAGHPWYYLLGNPVPRLKQIRAEAIALFYRGYRREEILAAANRPEPTRSRTLQNIRSEVMAQLATDVARFRKLACQLHADRRKNGIPLAPSVCDDIHTAISLKHNHIYNSFAHLALLDELPNQQGDLFE